MTTANPMLDRAPRDQRCRAARLHLAAIALLMLCGVALLSGCAGRHTTRAPVAMLVSPYVGREVVIAVAPLRNESGVSIVDVLDLSDTLVNSLQEADGLSVLPLNRTLSAMRAAGLASIDSPAQALALARVMGADAIVVGSLTAWHPYDPPRIGMNLAIFGRSDLVGAPSNDGVDPRALAASPTESRLVAFDPNKPLSIITEHFDGSDGALRAEIRRYAEGRFDPVSSLGWSVYVKSMGHFSRFACYRAAELLLGAEARRLGVTTSTDPAAEGGENSSPPPESGTR